MLILILGFFSPNLFFGTRISYVLCSLSAKQSAGPFVWKLRFPMWSRGSCLDMRGLASRKRVLYPPATRPVPGGVEGMLSRRQTSLCQRSGPCQGRGQQQSLDGGRQGTLGGPGWQPRNQTSRRRQDTFGLKLQVPKHNLLSFWPLTNHKFIVKSLRDLRWQPWNIEPQSGPFWAQGPMCLVHGTGPDLAFHHCVLWASTVVPKAPQNHAECDGGTDLSQITCALDNTACDRGYQELIVHISVKPSVTCWLTVMADPEARVWVWRRTSRKGSPGLKGKNIRN